MQKIRIEKMQVTDIAEVMRLEEESGLERWSEKSYRETLENPDYNMLVAKSESKIVGFVTMYFVSGEGYICNIAVKNDMRNHGIGTDLIKKIFELSETQKLKLLSLEVRKSNVTAVKFYEKLGFVPVGLRKNFYRDPVEDALIMTKHF